MTYCPQEWRTGDPMLGNIPSGVYLIINEVNGKQYVGLAKDVVARWRVHLKHARNNAPSHISRAIRKHGPENFSFRVLQFAPVQELPQLERQYIESLGSLWPHGYNMTTGGEATHGFRFSARSKELIRESTKRAWLEGRLDNRAWDTATQQRKSQSLLKSWDSNPDRRVRLSEWNTRRREQRLAAVREFCAAHFDLNSTLSYSRAVLLMGPAEQFSRRTLRDFCEDHNRCKR